METIARRKLSHEVLDRLVAAIESGEYSPGSQLPSERELMTRWGVGRPAIREAMQALQQAKANLRNIRAVDIVSTGIRGENLVEYRAHVRVAFLIEGTEVD